MENSTQSAPPEWMNSTQLVQPGLKNSTATADYVEHLSPATRHAVNMVLFFVYDIFPYPYFVLGVLGHSRSLYTCYQQSKTESGYMMQMFFSGIRIMEIIGFMLLIFVFNKWANRAYGDGAAWLRRSYVLMWIATHLIIPLANAFIIASMFMSIFISLDRVLAIGRPVMYLAKWQNKRYRVGALFLSLTIGFTLVSYDVGRLCPVYNTTSGLYFVDNDDAYQQDLFASIFNGAKNCANFGGLASLVLCNGVVVRLYRTQVVNSGINRLTRSDSAARTKADIRRENEQKQTQRTLFVLSVCQNVIATFSVGFMITMYLLEYVLVHDEQRYGIIDLGWPLCDGALMLAALLDFYVPVMVSKSLRRLMLPWCMKKSQVVPIIDMNQQEAGMAANGDVDRVLQ